MQIINRKSLAAVSAGLLAFIGVWEGGADGMVVYGDKYANNLPTTCYGITKHVTDEPVIIGEYWSKEKCERVAKEAIMIVRGELLRCMTSQSPLVPVSVLDALTSHAWNLGSRRTCNSTAMKYVNAGNYMAGCHAIAFQSGGRPNWSYAGGEFVEGLFNRRIDEYQYCFKGVIL